MLVALRLRSQSSLKTYNSITKIVGSEAPSSCFFFFINATVETKTPCLTPQNPEKANNPLVLVVLHTTPTLTIRRHKQKQKLSSKNISLQHSTSAPIGGVSEKVMSPRPTFVQQKKCFKNETKKGAIYIMEPILSVCG